MALIRGSNADILSWSMPLDDLVLWDSLAKGSMNAGAGADGIKWTNAGLYIGSWPCSLIISSGWAIAEGGTKIAGRLEGPSPTAFLSVFSSKLMRRATLAFRDSNSSWKWASPHGEHALHLPCLPRLLSETLTLLENGPHGEHALHLPCFLLGVCRLFRDLYFNPVQVCMLFTMDGCMFVDANVYTYTLSMNGKNPCRMSM